MQRFRDAAFRVAKIVEWECARCGFTRLTLGGTMDDVTIRLCASCLQTFPMRCMVHPNDLEELERAEKNYEQQFMGENI